MNYTLALVLFAALVAVASASRSYYPNSYYGGGRNVGFNRGGSSLGFNRGINRGISHGHGQSYYPYSHNRGRRSASRIGYNSRPHGGYGYNNNYNSYGTSYGNQYPYGRPTYGHGSSYGHGNYYYSG